MADDFMRDTFKINFGEPDADGKMSVTMSFVDLAATTERVQGWCLKVMALMEASGLRAIEVDPDRVFPLLMSGETPEAAAALLIAEARAAAPASDADALAAMSAPIISPWGDCPTDLPSLVAAGVMGLDWSEPDPLFHNGEESADEKANRHGQVQEIVAGALALTAQDIPATPPGAFMHPAPVEAADAHRAEAWEGTSLTCHLRSWPAAPPDADAFSAGYAGGLMVQAADEIDRLTREAAELRAVIDESPGARF